MVNSSKSVKESACLLRITGPATGHGRNGGRGRGAHAQATRRKGTQPRPQAHAHTPAPQNHHHHHCNQARAPSPHLYWGPLQPPTQGASALGGPLATNAAYPLWSQPRSALGMPLDKAPAAHKAGQAEGGASRARRAAAAPVPPHHPPQAPPHRARAEQCPSPSTSSKRRTTSRAAHPTRTVRARASADASTRVCSPRRRRHARLISAMGSAQVPPPSKLDSNRRRRWASGGPIIASPPQDSARRGPAPGTSGSARTRQKGTQPGTHSARVPAPSPGARACQAQLHRRHRTARLRNPCPRTPRATPGQ